MKSQEQNPDHSQLGPQQQRREQDLFPSRQRSLFRAQNLTPGRHTLARLPTQVDLRTTHHPFSAPTGNFFFLSQGFIKFSHHFLLPTTETDKTVLSSGQANDFPGPAPEHTSNGRVSNHPDLGLHFPI